MPILGLLEKKKIGSGKLKSMASSLPVAGLVESGNGEDEALMEYFGSLEESETRFFVLITLFIFTFYIVPPTLFDRYRGYLVHDLGRRNVGYFLQVVLFWGVE